jgi:serine protease inhibitor
VFIEVNEKGTEAAAATAAVMMRAMMPLVPPHEVRLDRPFVFGVQHVPSGAMLFLGVVERPELAK